MTFEEALAKAIAAAEEADEAQEARDRRGGLIDPDTSVHRAIAWASIANAMTTRNLEAMEAGL